MPGSAGPDNNFKQKSKIGSGQTLAGHRLSPSDCDNVILGWAILIISDTGLRCQPRLREELVLQVTAMTGQG